jgi:hypothetical protein
MAIADDFSVTVSGDIRHDSGTTNYTVLALHRFLQGLADDAQASGDDLVDITSSTPSERSTDNIITLINNYNIDDDAAQYFYDGSITQADGDTVYSGLQVLGAVNSTASGDSTQIMVVQDNDFYAYTPSPVSTPFWGDQSTGGYNGNAAAGILMQCMLKTREFGADIDGQRVRVQARHWGDTYDFFNVGMGQGISVAALGTTPDAQNTSVQGTVSAWSDVLNSGGTANAPEGGYQTIDLNEGSGAEPYYSQWTYGGQSTGLKALWEYTKDLSGNGTAKTIDTLPGELFLGITHDMNYDAGGAYTERETIVWGTDVTYSGLAGGTFAAGDYVTIGVNGAAGRVMYDNGSTNMIVALEDDNIALVAADTITIADGAGAVTAAVSGTPTVEVGGSGIVLATNGAATGDLWIQLLTGSAPINDSPIRGLTSAQTGLIDTAPVGRTVPKIFTGAYTGSYIGAFGVGIDPDDLTSSDSVQNLLGNTRNPPNNVQFTVSGLVTNEDYVLVGPSLGPGSAIMDKDQFTLATALTTGSETSVVINSPGPVTFPSEGDTSSTKIRVQNDNGIYVKQPYTSYDGALTFTIPSTSYSGAGNEAAATNSVFLAYLDDMPTSPDTSLSFTAIYTQDEDLLVRVRDGGSTPIKTFEAPATFGSAPVTTAAIRTTDA